MIAFYKLHDFFNSTCGELITSPIFEGNPVG